MTVTLAKFVLPVVGMFAWSQAATRNSRFGHMNVIDKLVLHEFVFGELARSKLDCARSCLLVSECEAFTFTKGSPKGLCHGHSVIESAGASQASAGSDSYVLEKLRKDCVEPPTLLDPPDVTSLSPTWGTTLKFACNSRAALVPAHPPATCLVNGVETQAFNCQDCVHGREIIMEGSSGSLASPGFPGSHGHHLNCTFVVGRGRPGPYTVSLAGQFQLEYNGACTFDYIRVNHNDRLCGTGGFDLNLQVIGEEGWTLLFHTDESVVTERAFLVHYHMV